MGTRLLNTFFLLLGIFFLATFLNFSSNPPNGRTGAPLEGGGNESTCMACHNPANPAFAGNIAISGLPASIDGSTTYPITVTLTATAGSPSRGGFQLVVLNSSFQNTGTLSESSPNLGIETSGGRTYMEHRNAISFSGNTVVYSFNWQAPATPDGEVITMYAAGNIANGSGTANDLIVLTSQSGTLAAAADPLAVSITASSNISCFGENDGTATATATGGSGGYSFAWSGGQTGAMVTGLSEGLATVTVTDAASGATATASVMITQPTNLNVNITSSLEITCVNPAGIVTVEATGGTPNYSFLWDNGETTATATNLNAGQHFVTVTDANNCTETASVMINQNTTPPIANAGNDASINCNNPSTVLDGTNSSLGGNFTYLWTTTNGNIQSGATTTVVTVNAAGTYQLLVTNTTNGCTATDEVVVMANFTPPTANAGADMAICFGDNAALMASATGGSGGYVFAWNNGLGAGASHTVSPNMTTNYMVTVTDSNGCTATDQVTVTVNPLPTPSITGDDVFCEGLVSTLDAGVGFASYLWSTGEMTQTIAVADAGTYCVTVTDGNNCTGNVCIAVTLNASPTISNIMADCAADFLSYTVTLTTNADQVSATAGTVVDNGGGNFTINSIPNDTDITITTTNSSTSCFSETNVTAPDCNCPDIDAPTSVSDTDISICLGDNMPIFSAMAPAGMVVDWYDAIMGGNLLLSTSNTFTPDAAGTFFAASHDPTTGCVSTGRTTFVLTINELPAPEITGNFSFCEGASTDLSVNAGFSSYNWSTGAATQVIIVNEPGTYCVTVTDINGCQGETCVAIIENPLPAITIVGDLFFCEGQCTIISWGSGVDEMQEICVPGTYTVSVTDENGCTATTSFDVVELSNPDVTISGDLFYCQGASTTLDAGEGFVSYTWSTGEVTQTIDVMEATTYCVTVTDENGCSGTICVDVAMTETPLVFVDAVACEGECVTIVWASLGINNSGSLEICDGGGANVDVADETTGCITHVNIGIQVIILEVDAGADFIMPCVGPAPVLNGMLNGLGTVIEWTTTDGNITAGANTLTPSIDSPGTYTLTVTAPESGCTASDIVVVSAAELPVIMVDEIIHVACNGESTGSITVSVSGGVEPYTYEWNDMMASTTATLNNISAGAYAVTVTDANGCFVTTSITVLEPTAIIVSLTATAESANGENDGSASSMVSGGTPPYTYEWSNGSTDAMISGLAPASYTLTVTDANNCENVTTAQVNVFGCEDLVAITIGDFLICPESTGFLAVNDIAGGTPPYSIAWSTGSMDNQINDLNPGHYSNTITDVNNCALITEYDIIEGDTIPPTLVTQNITIYLDENGEANFEPSDIDGGSTDNCGIGEFYVDNTNFDCSHLGENTVQIAVFDTGTLCDADSAIVTVLDTIPPMFTFCPADIMATNCLGVNYDMPAAMDNCGGITLVLTEGFASGESFPVGTTVVTHEATDASGNSTTCSFIVTMTSDLAVTLESSPETNMNSDGSIMATITGGTLPYSYVWANGILAIVGTEQHLVDVQADDYCLEVTDANGCTINACETVSQVVGTDEVVLDANIRIAPNPVAQQLYVHFDLENSEAARLALFNMNGQAIFQTEKEKGSDQLQIDVSAFADGVYLLKIIVGERVLVKRILVTK